MKKQLKEDELVTTKCRGETWEEADKRNNHFIKLGRKQEQKRIKKIIDEWASKSILDFDDDSIKQVKMKDDICRYVKKLKSKIKKEIKE